MTKISVITICYNSARTIEDTIKSVIYQNYPELEYIIIDGGSTDGTCDIIEKYRDKIAYYVSEPDNGISDAFNKGIKVATGDVIGIINSDDMYYKNAFAEVDAVFTEHPDTDVTFGNFLIFSDGDTKGVFKTTNQDLTCLKYTFELCHPTVFVKKSAYLKYGLFSLDYKLAMDYELLSKMYFNGAAFRYIDKIISVYRHGGISETAEKKTIKEHKVIAIRNGTKKSEIDWYMFKTRIVRRKLVELTKVFGVYSILRKKIANPQFYDIYWWE
ncbi:MAG: glycosyltransferase [Clostridia bacterium]|nr:glycosyltransferase [Clostridia bacterium]